MPDVRRARLYKQQSRQHWDRRLCLHPPRPRRTPVTAHGFRQGVELVSNLAAERVARLSIGLRHTIEAAAKYSQFCLFERGQLLRVSGDCEGPHVSALRSLRCGAGCACAVRVLERQARLSHLALPEMLRLFFVLGLLF